MAETVGRDNDSKSTGDETEMKCGTNIIVESDWAYDSNGYEFITSI